ncbi:MAG: carboxypeptidase regulatory-like domain-containing protein [Gemmatimonas sp.]
MRARWFALILLLFAPGAWAQTPSGANGSIIRGHVVSATGEPLAFAVVTIVQLDRQQFSNAQGRFVFVDLPAGSYRITVRQLGYTPAVVEVAVAANAAQDVTVAMKRVVTQLATVNVGAGWACEKPGRPASGATAQLIDVFEQLEQNAVRLRLLTKEYPFETLTERKRMLRYGDGLETLDRIDSVRSASAANARYEPGRVVYEVRETGKPPESRLQVPTLLDFADSLFQSNHCFILAGVEEHDGQSDIRVDFKPWSKLKSPDVEGSVYLHPQSFRLLRSELELTRIPKEVRGLERLHATTYFDDIVPGLPNVAEIVATSDLKSPSLVGPRRAVERIVTLRVMFRDRRPDANAVQSDSLSVAHSTRGVRHE